MKKSLPLILLLIIIALAFAQNEEKLGICVFTIRSTGAVSSALGDALTPLVGLELSSSKKLRIIEKS